VKIHYYDEDPHDRTKRFYGKKFGQLQSSKILVIGAGAVGNEVVKNLVLLGIKYINLVDHDLVNKSNSNRCVFFRETDHNKLTKVEAVKKRVQELTKDVIINSYPMKIQEAPEEVWDVDLIIIGVDNDYARYFVNAWLVSTNQRVPVVNGAMARSYVECEVLIPGQTACLTCLWLEKYYSEIINDEVKRSCDEFFLEVLPKFPAISTFTSIIGGIMVTEATKILTNEIIPENLGYLIRLNLEKYEYSKGIIMRNPGCVDRMCKAGYKNYITKMKNQGIQ
jgi:molybdopterin/thiamine biosynthesis adenylyltransferase